MEPNTTPELKRLPTFTARCKHALGHLYLLLHEIEEAAGDDPRIAELARRRHCYGIATALDPGAVGPITPDVHRAHLQVPHPLALAADDPRRKEPGFFVGPLDLDTHEPWE